MKRVLLAAAALLAVSVPASAQYPGGYYGERGYGGGYYDDRGSSRGRDYGRDERDDDVRSRRERWDDRRDRYDRRDRDDRRNSRDRYEGPPQSNRQGRGVSNTCATPRGACRVADPTPVGTPCGCVTNGVSSRGSVQ